MSDTLLNQLYNGDIYPAETMGSHVLPEERRCEQAIEQEWEYLKKVLSPEDWAHVENLNNLQRDSTAYYAFENFTTGFRLGAGLMLETLWPDKN